MKQRNGFTLVEMAIVLVIIGLLIGGILAAQSIITTARGHQIIQQASQYQLAARNFKTSFNYWPGDYPGNSFGVHGDGNGQIGKGDTDEGVMFFYHLSAAGFIKTPIQSYSGKGDAFVPGRDVPQGPVAGSYWIVLQNIATSGYGPGISVFDQGSWSSDQIEAGSSYLFYGRTCANQVAGTQCSIISPQIAQMIDIKLDDGMPNTGKVVANTGVQSVYSLTEQQDPCNAVWNIWLPDNAYAATKYNQGSWGGGFSALYGKRCVIGFKLEEY